jgi:hypothetical protein
MKAEIEWISIEDKLPELNGKECVRVLVLEDLSKKVKFVKHYYINEALYLEGEYPFDGFFINGNVSHEVKYWAYLPDMPEFIPYNNEEEL